MLQPLHALAAPMLRLTSRSSAVGLAVWHSRCTQMCGPLHLIGQYAARIAPQTHCTPALHCSLGLISRRQQLP
jgi:hypothetical protein